MEWNPIINREIDSEYDTFMNEYQSKHQCCPKCGARFCQTTLEGYILDMNNKESYKDLDKCKCMSCHNIHTMHDRISLEQAKELN